MLQETEMAEFQVKTQTNSTTNQPKIKSFEANISGFKKERKRDGKTKQNKTN